MCQEVTTVQDVTSSANGVRLVIILRQPFDTSVGVGVSMSSGSDHCPGCDEFSKWRETCYTFCDSLYKCRGVSMSSGSDHCPGCDEFSKWRETCYLRQPFDTSDKGVQQMA
ncbi:hypothetical protein J6590_049223 [Homalodisca vitripennis]|nr:hypothetical protein J6590_049223 [Homalodisca vitripennis]